MLYSCAGANDGVGMQTTRIVAAGFVLSLLLAASVQAADDVNVLRSHLDSGRGGEAWVLAEKLESQHAGNPDFDFLYAQAALAAGHPSQAIFALERVRLRQPGQQQAWLLLVRAYIEAGDSVRARRELEALMTSLPSAAMRSEAKTFSAQLNAPRTSRSAPGFVGLDIGYDSNVNSATDAISISGIGGSPTAGVVLAPEDRAQPDSFARLYAGYGGRRAFGTHGAFFADVFGYANVLYDQTQFSSSLYRGRVGIDWRRGRQHLALPLSRQVFNVDHGRYSIYDAAGLEWSYAISARQVMILGTSYGLVRYVDQPTRDARLHSAWFGWNAKLGLTHLGFNFRYGQDNARIDFNETLSQSNAFMGRQYYALGLDARYRWRPRHAPRLSVLLQSSRHDGTDPDFILRRQDQYLYYGVGWDWQLRPDWMLRADLGYITNRSNIDIHDYDRLQILVGARYDFR